MALYRLNNVWFESDLSKDILENLIQGYEIQKTTYNSSCMDFLLYVKKRGYTNVWLAQPIDLEFHD